ESHQRFTAAEVHAWRVALDREGRARDVLVLQVGELLAILLAPLRVAHRYLARHRPGLPYAEEPDPVETARGDVVEHGIGDVVEHCGPAEALAQLLQDDTGVDQVKRGVERLSHGEDLSCRKPTSQPVGIGSNALPQPVRAVRLHEAI